MANNYKKNKKGQIVLEPIGVHKRNLDMLQEEVFGNGRTTSVTLYDYFEDKGIAHGVNRNIGRDLSSILDGLNSVERRMLFTMIRLNLTPFKPRSKVSRIIGEAMKIVYPHGDLSPANTIGRMGRVGSIMIPYIDKEGNFGNPHDKRASAARYISARLSEYSYDCFFSENDVDKPIYDTKPNYSYDDFEPVYLPSKYPNALMQYSSAIGVGTSATIAAFNPTEVLETAIKLIEDPEAKINIYPDTMNEMTIINKKDLKGCFDKKDFYIKMRTPYVAEVIKDKVNGKIVDKYQLTFHGVPLNTKGKTIVETIIKLKREEEKSSVKRFKEIINVDFDASKTGDDSWIYIEYEKGYDPDVLAEKLYKSTQFETTVAAKYVFHKDNKPCEFTPRGVILEWIDIRMDQLRMFIQQSIVKYSIEKLRYEALIGIKSSGKLKEFVDLVRDHSGTKEELVEVVAKKYKLYQTQAKYLINMRLHSISKMSISDMEKELEICKGKYEYYRSMCNEKAVKNLMVEQLTDGIRKYGRPRLATLIDLGDKKNKDDDIVKLVYYNSENYFCIPNTDTIADIAKKMDSSYKLVEFRNGDTVMMFSRTGQMRTVSGYAFNHSQEAISLDMNLMENVSAIVPVSSNKRICLVSSKGVAKVLEVADIAKSSQCKVMNVLNDDILVDVIPIKTKGTLAMSAGDKMYYYPIDKIPVMKRSSAGNNILKDASGATVSHIAHIPHNHQFVMMYGDNGYMKVLSTQYLGYNKKMTDSVSMTGKNISGITSVSGKEGGDLFMYQGVEGEWVMSVEVKDHTVYIREGGKPFVKFPTSSTVGAPVKVFKKSKTEFYVLVN